MAKWIGREKYLRKKEERQRPAEPMVVIPEHQQKKIERETREAQIKVIEEEEQKKEEEKQQIIFAGASPMFEVDGLFSVGGISMVKGTLMKGRIKPKQKILSRDKKFTIIELRKNSQKVPILLQGENGALFLKEKKGFNFKQGDLLEIK